jgi:ATP-dependent DNA helicase RecQ
MASKESMLRQAIGKGKQEAVLEFIQNLPLRIAELNEKYEVLNENEIAIEEYRSDSFYLRNEKGNFENGVLIFCPYKKASTSFGVESVAALLKKEDYLEVGTFYAADDAENTTEDKFMITQSQFIRSQLNTLVATKAFGMGINKKNIRSTIHLNYPSSIESFVQEAGRAGRDWKTALCAVVYSDYPQKDKDILLGFHENSFRGKKKETEILFELLSEITYPVESSKSSISRYVAENTGIEVYFNLYPKDNPSRLYVQKGYNDGFGGLNLNNNMIFDFERSNYPKEECEAVLLLVKNYLVENDINKSNILQWLNKEIEVKPEKGIEERLKSISVGEPLRGDVIVGFRNNRIWKISKYLRNLVEGAGGYTEFLVARACKFLNDPMKFVDKLELEHYNFYNSEARISQEHHEQLRKWFVEIRDESDTYKAIFRLSVIKAIDDYEIDYNKNCIYLKIHARKSDQEYINNLKGYYEKYISQEDVNRRIANLENGRGNTVIQKCLSDVTIFVEEIIENKRLSAIDSMEQACIRGIQSPEDMRTSIRTYFDSRYVDDLRIDTHDGLEQSPKVLWRFMEESKGHIDNLEHLLGSSRRMLDDRPDNPVFILLQCFSLFLLYTEIKDGHLIIKNEDLIVAARKEFVRGIGRYEFLGENIEEILKGFKENILKYNNKLDTFITSNEEHIWLKIHSDWLANFNTKFYDNERN